MVSTRASQASQGGRKRARSPSPSAAPSIEQHHATKTRKTSTGRYFPTAEDQILQEQRESLERSLEPVEELGEEPASDDVACPTPTKSRPARHSLPANLQLPSNIKFESLRTAILRVNTRKRRHTEGVSLDGAGEDGEDGEDGQSVFIDPADLGIAPAQLHTPARSLVPSKHTPLSVSRTPSHNTKREDDIAAWEAAIKQLTTEKAHIEGRLQNTQLAIRSLGFGEDDMDEERMCAALRKDFDDVRAQLKEMDCDLPLDDMSNQEILQDLPGLIRGYLQDIQRCALALEQSEHRLTFIDAEYKGVLAKLAEREERNEAQEELLREADAEAIAKIEEIQKLTGDCADLRKTIESLKADAVALELQYEDDKADLEADLNQRIENMVEELDQEHEYREIAEREIAAKDAAYTELQVKYEATKEELKNTDEELHDLEALSDNQDEIIKRVKAELEQERKERDEVEEKFGDLEDKVSELNRDIIDFNTTLGERNQTIAELERELEDEKKDVKAKETEINQLRTEVFGTKEELKNKNGLVAKLEGDLDSLSHSMDNLKAEKDRVIEEKNEQLDGLEDELDERAKEIEQKDGDIAALRKENLRIMALNEEMRQALASRGKDVRVLKDITNLFINEAEKDIITTREWTENKQALVQNAKQMTALVGAETNGTTLTQQVEKIVVKKTVTMRDSAMFDGDDTSIEDEPLLENGY